MKNLKTRDLAYMSLYITLAIVLEYVSKIIPFEMANGGKIELHVIALFVAGLHLGFKKGAVVALLTFTLECLLGMNTWMINAGQICLDYILPLLACGIAPLYIRIGKNNIYSSVVIGMFIKFISHVISGAVFYAEGAPLLNWGTWSFSITYNLTFNLPTMIVALLVVGILMNKLKRYNNINCIGIKGQ